MTPNHPDPLGLRAELYQLYLRYKADELQAIISLPGTEPDMMATVQGIYRPDSQEAFERHLMRMDPAAQEAYVADLRSGYPGVPREVDDARSQDHLQRGEVPPRWRDRLGPGAALSHLTGLLRRSGPAGGRVV